MRIVIVGSVAAGANARRNTEDADISYSGCGLPLCVGGEVEDIDSLTPRDPTSKRYAIDIRTGHEVTGVIPPTRTDRTTGVSGARQNILLRSRNGGMP